jgi:NhaP-type Na+/H+ or K+/H+ antiporter
MTPAVISWAGTRGVVPLAAVLSIPLTAADGSPLPQRDLLLVLAVGVIVISLITQGLTLEPLVRRCCLPSARRRWRWRPRSPRSRPAGWRPRRAY